MTQPSGRYSVRWRAEQAEQCRRFRQWRNPNPFPRFRLFGRAVHPWWAGGPVRPGWPHEWPDPGQVVVLQGDDFDPLHPPIDLLTRPDRATSNTRQENQ